MVLHCNPEEEGATLTRYGDFNPVLFGSKAKRWSSAGGETQKDCVQQAHKGTPGHGQNPKFHMKIKL